MENCLAKQGNQNSEFWGSCFHGNERVDVVAGTKLNTFGGNGETHAALKEFNSCYIVNIGW